MSGDYFDGQFSCTKPPNNALRQHFGQEKILFICIWTHFDFSDVIDRFSLLLLFVKLRRQSEFIAYWKALNC